MFTGQVIHGVGYKKIGDINIVYAYLDDIVDQMIQEEPSNRPNSIEMIKKELIGRKSAFIALQKFDEAKKQVVSASAPPEFQPISIIGIDFDSGTLKLKLSRNVPAGWALGFRNPRGGHSAIMGYGPEQFNVSGDIATVGNVRSDEKLIQALVDNAKQYAEAANRGYVAQLRTAAQQDEQRERAALQKKIADAELRKNILSRVKL